jgi:hypothetical protein
MQVWEFQQQECVERKRGHSFLIFCICLVLAILNWVC